jgi:hypothetical protein
VLARNRTVEACCRPNRSNTTPTSMESVAIPAGFDSGTLNS